MEAEYEKIKRFAEATLGEMPEVIVQLYKLNEAAALEQFNENNILYLGRKNIPKKILAIIAMSVALANGPKESAKIHFKLAKRYGASNDEIVDAMRATKMALMSSTLDVASSIIDMGKEELLNKDTDSEIILRKLKAETGIVPERLSLIATVSTSLLKEHLRERDELLKPKALDKKYIFAIAYAVSVSIHDRECQKVYLDQFIKNGGNAAELEDIIAVTRFLTGNRAFVNGLEILRSMNGY
ncbi:MAG: carboxymuconolactone decarboxylase family protein [Nitrososphaeria archaeon]|jgi:alkylhydroperoxidase/carboxymuconolactone decarboxylase family protein YurZ